jgi:limonene-1,2-epoxide hydrolase
MGARFDILKQVIAAWQAKDLDRVLALMHDDIVWHYAAPGAPPVRGKAKAEKLLKRLQADMHDIAWRIFAHAEAGDRLFIEGVDEYTNAEGRRIAVPYAGVLEFQGDQIIGWRDYVDLAVISQQQSGEAAPAHVRELLAREAAS